MSAENGSLDVFSDHYLQFSQWYDVSIITGPDPHRISCEAIVVVVLACGLVIELPPLVLTHWLPGGEQ